MQKIYSRINWENFPSEKTAVNESNLNKMDLAIDNLDDRVVAMDASKVDLAKANELVKEILWDESNGRLTVVKMNGSRAVIDTKLEKLAVNFTYNPQTQQLVITLDDGTVQNVDLSALITQYEFLDSDTIAFEVADGKVKAIVKNGSITEEKLNPTYLGEIRTQVARAESSATSADASEKNAASSSALAKSYAVGGTGTRDGEDTDNAKYYAEQAKSVSDVDIATTDKAGIVKPDGTTITVDEDGTLHGQSKVDEMTGATADKDGTSGTVPAPKAGQESLFLRGDGTWAKASGGSTIAPKATVDPAISSGNAKVTISWGDPEDVVLDGAVLSAWKGTKLVMKESGYPDNESDGTLILDNTVRDAHKTSGYVVDGLTNGNTYYFALFPYSTDDVYNYSTSNRLLGNPSLVKLDSCSNVQISAAMGSVTVSWEDPEATKTVDGNTATWAKTVLVYKQGSAAPNSPSDGTISVTETVRNQYSSEGYEVTGLTDGEQYSFSLFAVSTEENPSDAACATAKLWATLTATTTEETLFGKTVTASNGEKTVSGVFGDLGSVILQIPWIGETTITSTDGTDTATSVVTISAYESTYSGELSFLKIVTFSDGTDEEIAAMVTAHYNDKINIADYWAVGDTRTVHLSAMSATGVGESHREQDVEFVIGDFEHDDLATAINGHTKAAITLLQKDCLMDATSASNLNNGSNDTENGYMNSSGTNVGSWTDCARRKWCNDVYYNALPTSIKEAVKEVNKLAGNRKSNIIITTSDKVFLLSEIEIFGSITISASGEGSQYTYYKTTANRYKLPKYDSSSVSNRYWERSASYNYFGNVGPNCAANNNPENDTMGLAPCLCI